MLKIINSVHQLKFSELMRVYSEANMENGAQQYSELPKDAQIREAEADFYNYLCDFFRVNGAFYGLWVVNGKYMSALRMEPYKDGWLMCALETTPDERRKGYATLLVCAVLSYMSQLDNIKIYSHVSKKNYASISTHMKCGFRILLDYAVYLDGSVQQNSYTFTFNTKTSET